MAGEITAIRVQKRNSNRANIFIDGEFAFGLQMIDAIRLTKGQRLSDSDIAALKAADEIERAYEYALNFLSHRPRSSTEVAQRLQRQEFSTIAVDSAITRLTQAGLLDDRAFTEYWIHNREQFKPRGQRALRYELRQKGISTDTMDELLDQVDETKNAYLVAAQWIDRWKRARSQVPDLAVLRRKLSGYLQRRGFGYEVIQETWARIQDEQLAEGDLEGG
jgi:regulatory protein